jgi:pimeloyl-ACP methyl ester carboxylesterase
MNLKYKNSSIFYTTHGSGEAIVLLHGFLENEAMWRPFIPQLSKNNKVICIDLLGHGQTDCLGYLHTMEDMANAVFEVLKHETISKAIFIGHSMGGYVALALAERHPKLFKGLCLMNSTFEADNSERKKIRTRAIKMAQTNYESLIRISFANLFATKSKVRFKSEFQNALNFALKTPVQGYIAAQEGMKLRTDKFDIFRNLNSKKVVIIGEKDTVVNGGILKSKLKDTTAACIEFSEGHMSHIENREELSYFFNHFIEK